MFTYDLNDVTSRIPQDDDEPIAVRFLGTPRVNTVHQRRPSTPISGEVIHGDCLTDPRTTIEDRNRHLHGVYFPRLGHLRPATRGNIVPPGFDN